MWKWNNNIYKHLLSPTIILSCLCPPYSSIPFLITTLNSFWGLPTLYTDLEEYWIKLLAFCLWKTEAFMEIISTIFSLTFLIQSEAHSNTSWTPILKKRMKIIFSSNNALTTYFLLWHDFSLPFLISLIFL